MGVDVVSEDVVSINFVVTSLMDENEKKKKRFCGRKKRCMHIVLARNLSLKAYPVVMYCLLWCVSA